MKTASKLAQLARANQNKQEKVQLTKDGKVVFIGTRESAERWMCENGGTYSVEKWKPQSFQKKVSWASHQYVRFVKQRCKELASKGYGSVEIKLDKTTDLFNVDEGRNSCYSAEFVFSLLNREGFIWKNEPTDYYDAISDVIIWDRELPQAPSSEKIGMCWK